MPSKISWFNKEIVFQNARTSGWIAIAYFLVLFFSLPLRLIMMATSEKKMSAHYYKIENFFSIDFPIQYGLLLVVPVLMSIFLFRFMQVKASADLMNSLPVKKAQIFHQHALFGAVSLVVPVLGISLLLYLLHGALALDYLFKTQEIVHWMGNTILTVLTIYITGVLVAVLTGISAVQAVLTYIVLLFPAGVSVLVIYNFKYYLYGFPIQYYTHVNFEKASPISQAADLNNIRYTGIEWAIYLCLIVVMYFGSLFIYKIRKVEGASQAIVFPVLKPIFKFGVTFCFILLGGAYFGEVQDKTGWVYFGYTAGSLLGYFLAEMVLQKSWRVFHKVRGYFLITGASALIFLALHFDVAGYEKRIPSLNEIEAVYLSDNPYDYLNEENREHISFFKERSTIEKVYNLQKQMLENKDLVEGKNPNLYREEFFVYKLKNGKKYIRQYPMATDALYAATLKSIYETKEYKESIYKVLNLEEQKVDTISIQPIASVSNRVVFSKPDDIAEVLKVLRQDIRNERYEDYLDKREPWGNIEIITDDENNNMTSYSWRRSYKLLEKYLEDKGLLEDVRVDPSDFSHTIAIKAGPDFFNSDPNRALSMEEMILKKYKEGDGMKIEAPQKQFESWESSRNVIGEEMQEYVVAFYFKGGDYPEIRSIIEKDAPEFLKEGMQ